MRVSPPSVVCSEVYYVSPNERFAALQLILSRFILRCGDRGGRCPPMTVSLSYGFFLSVSRFEIVTLRFPVRGSSGRIELDPSCRTDHSTI